MQYWVIVMVALVLAGLLMLIVGIGRARPDRKTPAQPPRLREPCPICGAPLAPGERIRSALFPGKRERLTHLFGCSRCYPPDDRYPRSCPVCRSRLPPDGYVVGRMWERRPKVAASGTSGRPRQHLHILGCAACRLPRRPEVHPCP